MDNIRKILSLIDTYATLCIEEQEMKNKIHITKQDLKQLNLLLSSKSLNKNSSAYINTINSISNNRLLLSNTNKRLIRIEEQKNYIYGSIVLERDALQLDEIDVIVDKISSRITGFSERQKNCKEQVAMLYEEAKYAGQAGRYNENFFRDVQKSNSLITSFDIKMNVYSMFSNLLTDRKKHMIQNCIHTEKK